LLSSNNMKKTFLVLLLACSISRAESIADLMARAIPGCYWTKASEDAPIMNILQINPDGSAFVAKEGRIAKWLHAPELPELEFLQKNGITAADIRKKLGIEHGRLLSHIQGSILLKWNYFSIKDNELTILGIAAEQDWNYTITNVKSYVKSSKLSDYGDFRPADEATQKKLMDFAAKNSQIEAVQDEKASGKTFTIIFETDASIHPGEADFKSDLLLIEGNKKSLLKVLGTCERICSKADNQSKAPSILFKMTHALNSRKSSASFNPGGLECNEVKKHKSPKQIKVILTRDEKILAGALHRFDAERNCIFMHPRSPENSLAHNLGHAAGYVGRFDEGHSEDYYNLMAPFENPITNEEKVDEQYATKVLDFLKK